MLFEKSIKEGYAKEVKKDKLRAQSLIKSAEDTILATKDIYLKDYNYKTVLRELYEALRQYCEAVGYVYGYKFLSHEVITIFLKEILKEERISLEFDRYRKLRNGINYYGRDVSKETVENALIEIPQIIKRLQIYCK